MQAILWVTVGAFLLLAALSIRLWRRGDVPESGWVAAAFAALASALLLGRINALDLPDAADVALTALSATGLLAFPYLLLRFAVSFGTVSARARRAADLLALAVIAVTLALVPFFATADAEPAWFLALLILIVGYWTVLTVWVFARLWRAGRGRPTVARRRMRALALSSGLLNLALFVSLLVPGDPDAVTLASRLLAIGAAGGFYLAFTPPGVLRREWRRPEEQLLRAAPMDVLRAEERAHAAEAVLPRVAQLFGTGRAAFLDAEGRPLAALGVGGEELREATQVLTRITAPHQVAQQGDWIGLRLGGGWLGVGADPFAPFFGSEEMELLATVGGFLDLALERVELLEAERDSKARIEAASRELEALLYGISHDLRNPLVSVLGYLEVLEEDAGDALDDNARHYIDRLRANAGYMDALISDLLELSRVGRTDRETGAVALAPVVEEVVAELQREHPSATIRVGQLPVVEINPVRARQLFANLVGNALKHGGRADLDVSIEGCRTDGELAEIVVADDGKGIPEPHRDRVFRIFEQLEHRSEDGGTGIGLAMCRRIVEQLGGRIWIGDVPVGTAVHVELPAARAAARQEVSS